MGLDQNWLIDDKDNPGEHKSIAYHRKFNALEGFMEKKWRDAGNESEFNCEYLPITDELLDELETKAFDNDLEPLAGFFFGNTDKDEYYDTDIKELLTDVIPRVRQYIKDGEAVYYRSWW